MSYRDQPLTILIVLTVMLVGASFAVEHTSADQGSSVIMVDDPVPTYVLSPSTVQPTKVTIEAAVPDDYLLLNPIESLADILLAEYAWGRHDNVYELQEVLNITVDGNYGPQTQAAHIAWLESVGWSTGNVPGSSTVSRRNVNPTPQCTEWWDTARAAGWDEDRLARLGQIMFAESTCRHYVVSRTKDYGLTQINWAAHGSRLTAAGITRDMLLDPYVNLVQAKIIADYAERHYGCWSQPWYMSGEWC